MQIVINVSVSNSMTHGLWSKIIVTGIVEKTSSSLLVTIFSVCFFCLMYRHNWQISVKSRFC